MRATSRVILLCFLLAETIFIALFFILGIVKKDWYWSAVIFLVLILANFLIVAFTIWFEYNTVVSSRSNPIPTKFEASNFHDKTYREYLTETKFVCLIIASTLVIGT